MNLSKSDERCVFFARCCQEYRVDPYKLAELCAASRAAMSAIERDSSRADERRRRVEQVAGLLGWSVDWPSKVPHFKNYNGIELRIPF